MLFIYNIVILIASQLVKVAALFSPKIKLFVSGRKNVFEQLEKNIQPTDKSIWFHAASLGEYEQGLPVIEQVKKHYPNHKIIVTFFSPSGFEVRKNNTVADVTIYLPLDSKANAKRFIALARPELVFFIKYEFWPNYLNELKKQEKIFGTKTYLISGNFRANQVFFKWYGGFYRKALQTFDYFFVQNEASKKLLQSIGFSNVQISGDTRFDRVATILERDNSLDFMNSFASDDAILVVIGSSWPKDEEILAKYINESSSKVKFVIAPHNIKEEQIIGLQSQIKKATILLSEINNKEVASSSVLLVDNVGLLTKIYAYADIAYVGGGFGNPGVHNVLEPAVFGIPIIIGPNYSHFMEAKALVNLEGCVSIANENELKEMLDLLIQNEDERHEKGHINETFIKMNQGATRKILNFLLTRDSI